MAKHILKCTKCGKFTMKEECPACGSLASDSKPPKYSPEDKYGRLRRQTKEPGYKEKGLLS